MAKRGRPKGSKNKKVKSVDEHIQKELKNPEFKKEYNKERIKLFKKSKSVAFLAEEITNSEFKKEYYKERDKLSKESKKSVKKGLQEAKEGKLERVSFDKKGEIIFSNSLVAQNNNQINIEKEDKLKEVVNKLTKSFGHDIVHFASEEKEKERIKFIVPEVNNMIGGGIPCGQFSILWGNKSCAKTTITYYLMAQAQKQGKICAYFDLEHSFDKIWAEKCGVDLNRLLIGRFKTAEEAMDTLIIMAKEKVIDFAVLDSVQSLSPKGEQETKKGKEKSTGDDTMALLARKLSIFFRMSANGVYRGKVAVLLIGQARINLGGFIKLETLSGGNALAHWAVTIVKVHRGQKIDAPRYKFKVKGKKKEIIIGFSLVIKLEKTKISGCAPEGTELRIPFYYEYAFNKPTDKQTKDLYKDWIEMEESTNEDN